MSFPTKQPIDEDLRDRILKLATYVARNGLEFENKVKSKEAQNLKFLFLQNPLSDEFCYYRWILYCYQNHLTDDDISWVQSAHMDKLVNVTPGYIDLSKEDHEELWKKLLNNSGSKESIKSLRKWIVDRAHSAASIAVDMAKFARFINQNADVNSFTALLHLIYVINDIFCSSKNVTTDGPYTKLLINHKNTDVISIFCPHLRYILHIGYIHAPNDISQEKVLKVVNLWKLKELITSDQYADLLSVLNHSDDINFDLPELHLLSPHPILQKVHDNIDSKDQLIKKEIPLNELIPREDSNYSSSQGMIVSSTVFPPKDSIEMKEALSASYSTSQEVIHPIKTQPIVDVFKIPVGRMADMVRFAINNLGHPKYSPIDFSKLINIASPYLEPGRLDARIAEYYTTIHSGLDKHFEPSLKLVGNDRGDDNLQKKSIVPSWEDRYAESLENKEQREYDQVMRDIVGDTRSRKYSRIEQTDVNKNTKVDMIDEANMGHKLLRGFGWKQGSGLGAEGGGIIEPIREVGKKDKDRAGLGAEGDESKSLSDHNVDFSAYRKQLSTEYHHRMGERESTR